VVEQDLSGKHRHRVMFVIGARSLVCSFFNDFFSSNVFLFLVLLLVRGRERVACSNVIFVAKTKMKNSAHCVELFVFRALYSALSYKW
jgi:predicted membrane protein